MSFAFLILTSCVRLEKWGFIFPLRFGDLKDRSYFLVFDYAVFRV